MSEFLEVLPRADAPRPRQNDDSCQSCEVPAKACERSRANRAEACCTDCAMDAPWVLHCMADPHDDPKHRGPAYRRGFADGVLAGRAGITDPRLPGSNDDEEDDRG